MLLKQEKFSDKLKDKLFKIANGQKIKILGDHPDIIKNTKNSTKNSAKNNTKKTEIFYNEIIQGMKRNQNDIINENSLLKDVIIKTYKKIKQIQFGVFLL